MGNHIFRGDGDRTYRTPNSNHLQMARFEASLEWRLRRRLCSSFDVESIAIHTEDSGRGDTEGLISFEAVPDSLRYTDFWALEVFRQRCCIAEGVGAGR